MTPLEKLRADVLYWQEQAATARETLRIAEAVLPGLEAQLEALQPVQETTPAAEPTLDFRRLVSPTDLAEEEEEEEPGSSRLSGTCAEQVLQALARKPNQSAADLHGFLWLHGRQYGRGAIGYALRALRASGEIREAGRQGNSVIYSLR